ncbi:MAG TPA: class I SAM-dependent methyltransferase [Kofleriaceae bacterium]|nr:class I SAM-dependent methyltransferase [Kofleriaceae bacterium]
MHRVLVVCLLSIVACGGREANGHEDGSGSTGSTKVSGDGDREQARFDADRKPEEVVKALGIKPGSVVADIGAGAGLMTVHIARAVKPGGKVVATEIDSAVLELMHNRMVERGLDDIVERRVVAAETPGLEPGMYDAILVAEVDHLLADPVAWLKAAIPALKPGGRLVISNRVYRRSKSLAAAEKAGLKLVSESNPVSTHFVAVFVAPTGGSK